MTKETTLGNEPIPAVEFVEVKKRIVLDALECEANRIGTIVRDIPFTDYSTDPPVEVVFEARLTPVTMEERKQFIKRCTTHDRAGIPEIDFDRLDDLLMAKVFGYTEDQWKKFTKNHPEGLYMKLALLAKEVNGELNFTDKQITELKNLAVQEQ